MSDPDHTKSPDSVKQSDFRALLKEFNKQGVFVPRTFIDFTGDTQAASLFKQILYWSERTSDPDGWFYKTYDEWKAEIGLSKFQVSRCVSKLKPLGLETIVKKAGKAPKVHYRINYKIFEVEYRRFLDSQETGKSRNLTNQSPSDSEVSRLSSFSIVNSEETSLSSYIDYIQREESLQAENESLRKELSELKIAFEEIQKQLKELLATPSKPVLNEKKKQPALAIAPRPRDPVFDALATVYVAPGGNLNGLNGWVGKVEKWLKELAPELSGELAKSFAEWWCKDNKLAAKVRDKAKIQAAYATWRNSQPKPPNLDENGADLDTWSPDPDHPGIYLPKGAL